MQTPDWRQSLACAFTDLPSLCDYLELPEHHRPQADAAMASFRLRVPREFAALMRRGDPGDPLLRQVLPLSAEMDELPGFTRNPVGDTEARIIPGLLHKYRGRVLIVATGACAINCRYCFRRHYPYAEGAASPRQWADILDYLAAHPEIDEVILSGGDPLMTSDERLAGWLEPLETLSQIRRLRLHTRLPVVVPSRVTPELLRLLRRRRFASVVVLHVNHPNELSPQVVQALMELKSAGVTLLNQAVLLRGVNDDLETLALLSQGLFEAGVMPYYLHLLDRVAGAAHFEVSESRARSLHRQLLARLPGYLVPKMVREIAGEPGKTPLPFLET